MKLKYLLFMLLFSMIFLNLGAFLKIMHWPFAGLTLVIGSIVSSVSGFAILLTLLFSSKYEDIINR